MSVSNKIFNNNYDITGISILEHGEFVKRLSPNLVVSGVELVNHIAALKKRVADYQESIELLESVLNTSE